MHINGTLQVMHVFCWKWSSVCSFRSLRLSNDRAQKSQLCSRLTTGFAEKKYCQQSWLDNSWSILFDQCNFGANTFDWFTKYSACGTIHFSSSKLICLCLSSPSETSFQLSIGWSVSTSLKLCVINSWSSGIFVWIFLQAILRSIGWVFGPV